MYKLLNVIGLLALSGLATLVNAAEIEVKMLNKGSDGEKMVFEPALIIANVGDTITFLPTDKGHMAASVKGMLPEGAKKFKGKTNKPVSYVVSNDGLYGVRCTPHYANGMVALIAVGSDLDKENFLKGKKVSKKAKMRFESMLNQL
jgi:pseudoazurin